MNIDENEVLRELEEDYERDPLLKRVTCDPAYRGGKPYLRHVGLTVRQIINLIDAGNTIEEIVKIHPRVEKEDVHAALRYAAWKVGVIP